MLEDRKAGLMGKGLSWRRGWYWSWSGAVGTSEWGARRCRPCHPAVLILSLNLRSHHVGVPVHLPSPSPHQARSARIKERKKPKERKGLITWLEILTADIKFYELPIAQHPVFLTSPVSHTVL